MPIFRPSLEDLSFKSIDEENGADLIKPFFLEEIKEAVWEISRVLDQDRLLFQCNFYDILWYLIFGWLGIYFVSYGVL